MDKPNDIRGLERGEIRTGVVTTITDFGAFVDIGGLRGLVHYTEMGGRVGERSADQIRTVVTEGQQVSVEVLDVDVPRERISLALR